MRLNRYLAAAGLGSRRSCEQLIREGRVEVNGKVADFPGPDVDLKRDQVRCDGSRIQLPRSFHYLALNKPAGYLTTLADERGRKTVEDLLGRWRGRVFPVGRLDRASEGLILLTNNGELSNRLLHPRYGHERVYSAWVRPVPDPESLARIREGLPIGGGERSGPARVRLLGRKADVGRVRIALREGKYREVRRIFAACGMRVLALRRVLYAGIHLGELRTGAVRVLTDDERAELARRTGLTL